MRKRFTIAEYGYTIVINFDTSISPERVEDIVDKIWYLIDEEAMRDA